MIFELRSKPSAEYFIYRSKGLCMTDTILKWNGGIPRNVGGKERLTMDK